MCNQEAAPLYLQCKVVSQVLDYKKHNKTSPNTITNDRNIADKRSWYTLQSCCFLGFLFCLHPD